MDFRKIAPCDFVNPGVRREFIARHIARELLLLADGCELKSAVAETSQLVCYVYNRLRQIFAIDGGSDMVEAWLAAKKDLVDNYKNIFED